MKNSYRRILSWPVFLAAVFVLDACTEPLRIEDVQIRPTSMSAVGATTFNAVAGSTTQNPAMIRVLDQDQALMANQSVSFAASRGTLSSQTASTNAQGQASPASWTAPTSAGPATITASIPNTTVAAVTFNITVTAAAAQTQTKTASTDGLSAIAGTATASAPEVTVADQYGNGVSGVVVTFTIQTGGGTVNGTSATTANITTDANGKAKLTSWILGPTIGANTLRATTTVLPTQPLTFTATGTTGPVNKIVIAPPGNSQGQTATAGTNVANAPTVFVSDVNNNAIANIGVRFAIGQGGGKIINGVGAQVVTLDVTTNASGIATIPGWMVWDPGNNTLNVSIPTASGVTPFVVTATSVAGAPTQIAVVTETPSSDGQTGIVGQDLAVAPGVIVRDANGFAVGSVSVSFTLGANSGTIRLTSGGSEVTSGSINTNASGVARLHSWKPGTRGANTLVAALTANNAINVTLTATGTAGPPASIAIENVGTMQNQSTIANTPVGVSPAVVLRDANNLTVEAGVAVTFVIQSGGGSVSCAGATTSTNIATNANGVATLACWRPGTVGNNANTLRAFVVGSPGIFVTFTATGTVGPPTQIAVTNQPWPLTRATLQNGGVPKVQVTDAGGNGVAGLTINWSNNANANSTVGGTTSSVTDATGTAQFQGGQGGTWVAANVASGSVMQLLATVAAQPSLTALTSSIIVTAPTQITSTAAPSGSTTVNTVATPTPAFVVRDASNRPVPGAPLTWSIPSNPGGSSPASLTGQDAATDSVGQADAGSWKVASTAGANTITATVTATAVSINYGTTGVAGAASQIAVNGGNTQSAPTSTAVAVAPSVIVRDQFSNVVSGVSVTFTPTAGSGSVTGSPANTNASGIATLGSWTLGASAGTHTLNASLTATPAVTTAFTATATSADPCASPIAHTVGNTVNGTLAASDCNVAGTGGTFYADLYRVTVGASQTAFISATMTPTGFTGGIRSFLYRPTAVHWISEGTGSGIALTRYYLLGTGTHDLGATSALPTTTGSYQFSTNGTPTLPQNQCTLFATKGVTATLTLTGASCVYAQNGQTTQVSYRNFLIYLPANQTLTVRMNAVGGNGLDSYLEAYDFSTDAFLTSDDDGNGGLNSLMVVAASASARFIEIVASHHISDPQNTLSFQLIIDP